MLIQILTKCFVKKSEDIKNPAVRTAYGVFGGVLGIMCNLVLFVIKLTIGSFISSIAIISDAFNNLSDIGSSALALFGAKMSSQKPDEKHPFGHGRIEYICSLLVSFIIVTMGIELIQSSFSKIINPVSPTFHVPMLVILSASVLIKLWMFFAMRYLGDKIDSDVLKATASDSLSDTVATGVVVLSVVFSRWLPPITDGIAGLVVAILICITGGRVAWDTINTLLGASPDPILMRKISDIILENDEILGVHDLIVHDYGPGRTLASVHAEVSSEKSAIYLHEIIDTLEDQIFQKTGVETVIHTDPILVGCEKADATRMLVKNIIETVNPEFGMHDFRMTDGESRINLIFDLEVPFSITETEKEKAVFTIKQKLKQENPCFCCVIRTDYKPQY